jgi:ribosomal protein S12 methylthiotransferase
MKTKPQKQKSNKVNIVTLGCSKNLVDSEVLMNQLYASKIPVTHEQNKSDANIVIVNTCGFVDLAKQESIDTILAYADAKASKQIDKLYVTGCLSQRYKNELENEIPEVDGYFGTFDLPFLLQELNANYKHELIGERPLLTTPNHYAYLKVSEGCNRTCAFCAIPLMRGQHVSKTMDTIVAEAKNLAKQGVKEIMLIAQELTFYGIDISGKRQLPDLLRRLNNEVEGIEWIRLHYAYPHKFPLEIIEAMAQCEKVCNYLDIPLQHISDPVLKRMRRLITQQETEQLILKIRDILPNIALRTTMLVGFPGETQQDIDQLAEFIQKIRFERMGIFQYSHEEGTFAGQNYPDDVPQEEKAMRANQIMDIQAAISAELNQQKIDNTYDYFVGRTEFDSPEVDNEVLVDAKTQYARIGDFANVTIHEATDFDLFGSIGC